MLKNTVSGSRNEDQETAEWISEDDAELVRMPARSISTVKIETYLEAETNLLHLDLKTAIPMRSEPSRVDTNQGPQHGADKDALTGPKTKTQGLRKTTKPPGAGSLSGEEGGWQGGGTDKEERDTANSSSTHPPGPDDDCCPPAYVEADGQCLSDLSRVRKGARLDDVVALKAALDTIHIPPHGIFASFGHWKQQLRLDISTTANRQGGEPRTKPVPDCGILIDSISGRGRLRGGCESQEPPRTSRLAQKTLALVHLEELDIESDTDIRFLDLKDIDPVNIKSTSCEHLSRSLQ